MRFSAQSAARRHVRPAAALAAVLAAIVVAVAGGARLAAPAGTVAGGARPASPAVDAVPAAAAPAVAAAPAAAAAASPDRCRQLRPPAAHWAAVDRALRAGQDVWGNALLRATEGPTYAGAARYLRPLFLARAPGKRPLTDSGVHYVPFAQPLGVQGAGSVALHVADGGQILSDRVAGRRLTVLVGAGGRERYGSCLARLPAPRLAEGHLPILQTRYVDAVRTRYRQESFAAQSAATGSLVSFVRLTAEVPRSAPRPAVLRFRPAPGPVTRAGNRLVRGRATLLAFSPGARFDGASITYPVAPGTSRTVYVAFNNYPAASRPLEVGAAAYEAARRSVVEYWQRRLAEGMSISVPEKRVVDAQRALLVQNLSLTWRYSIGNPYEQFSFPESVDVAQVAGEYGFPLVSRSIMRTSLTRRPIPYPNWKMGQKLVGSASYYRLHRDRAYVDQVTPQLRGYVAALGRQIEGNPSGMLNRERYSSDIPDSVFGLHSQAVVWRGLREMASVWAETGNPELARRARTLAARLEGGLRSAVARSQRRLPDGSLFMPVRLLDPEPTYRAVMESRSGSYWNLVMPYVLASGFFRPGSTQADGVWRYMQSRGSRLLGLVRSAGFALYTDRTYPVSGTNPVYGINVSRFLAETDRADQLVLSLYGQLAAGMTRNTFVSGEAGGVAPLEGGYYRATYLPPNSASNAAFLVTLRLMLVHETRDRNGDPHGLRLAYATPRPWLRPGRRIAVRDAPTSFGPVSYTLESRVNSVRVVLDAPERARPGALSLRLRLPDGRRITGVTLDDRPYRRFDARTGTIDLTGHRGRVELTVSHGGGRG